MMTFWTACVAHYKRSESSINRASFLNFLPFVLLFFGLVINAPVVAAEQEGLKILPKSLKTTITGPDGETYFAIPRRIFLEYGMGSTKSDSYPLATVDIDVKRVTAGVDFVTSSFWFWGISLNYIMTGDSGSSIFAPSIETDKNIGGGSIYITRQVMPGLQAGMRGYYSYADGKSVFNGADTVTEKSDLYGFNPFFKYTLLKKKTFKVTTGASLNVSFGDFDYVANIPPTSKTNSIVLRIPVTISKDFGKYFSASASATLNQEISRKSFGNVPTPDETTLTLGAYGAFKLDNGTSIYVRGSYDAFDSAYDSYRGTIGVSVPLLGPGR